MMIRKRGFTLIELLVVIAIIALLIGLLLPALAKAQKNARSLKDKTQIKQIHQAMLVYAEDNKGRLPIPGLINRLADPHTGLQLPGRGNEDFSRNNTAELYAAMIAQDLIDTKILIGPTEVSPYVREDPDYDFDEYDPTIDQYWDPDFIVDIESGPECNASYFHMALCGKRKDLKWRDTAAQGDPMVATRAPRDGAVTGDEYKLSPTLELHGTDEQWFGNVVFADNHIESINNFFPSSTNYLAMNQTSTRKDNIYNAEFMDFESDNGMASNDAFLIISQGAASENEVNAIYDPLEF